MASHIRFWPADKDPWAKWPHLRPKESPMFASTTPTWPSPWRILLALPGAVYHVYTNWRLTRRCR